jgi:hypothetical protein
MKTRRWLVRVSQQAATSAHFVLFTLVSHGWPVFSASQVALSVSMDHGSHATTPLPMLTKLNAETQKEEEVIGINIANRTWTSDEVIRNLRFGEDSWSLVMAQIV